MVVRHTQKCAHRPLYRPFTSSANSNTVRRLVARTRCGERDRMELSFRTYGMIGAFVTIPILLWFQWSLVPDGGGNFLVSVLGISAGGVLFAIECLDFWRYVGTCAHAPCVGPSPQLAAYVSPAPPGASLACTGSAATASGATAARRPRPRQPAWSDTSRTSSIAASCTPLEVSARSPPLISSVGGTRPLCSM
eukprot:COSAG02_NODE_2782_length_8037_cov_15.993827_4_plen_193_part_00